MEVRELAGGHGLWEAPKVTEQRSIPLFDLHGVALEDDSVVEFDSCVALWELEPFLDTNAEDPVDMGARPAVERFLAGGVPHSRPCRTKRLFSARRPTPLSLLLKPPECSESRASRLAAQTWRGR